MYKLKARLIASPIALICLLLLLPGPALADDLDEIVEDFCEDVARDIQDVVDDSADISEDLADATADFVKCLDRARNPEDGVECSVKLINEVADANEEAANSCTDFVEDFFGDIERALGDAEDDGLVDEFLADPEVTEKLITGLSVVERCSTALNP